MHRLLRIFLPVLIAWSVSPTYADIVAVSSITSPSAGGTNVNKNSWLADKFITGTDISLLTLTSITINFEASSGTGGYFVSIYTDTSGQPGSLLSALTGSTNPNTAGNFTYTPTTPLSLSPSTSYWLVEGSTLSTVNYQPAYETNPSSFTGHGWTITGVYTFSTNSGSTWGGGASDGPTQYRISVQFVPEPAFYAALLGILSLGAVIFIRRRANRVRV